VTAGVDLDRLLAEADRRLFPGPAARPVEPDDGVVAALRLARGPILLAGPGVVVDGCVAGLHALAEAGSLGVLNTWGAKGVFDWRSPHHLATAGLQARDFELAGITSADLVVATGVDLAEAPPERWRTVPVIEVPPGALAPLAARWSRPRRPIDVPPLRAALAAVTQEGWASTGVPLAPSLVTRNYAEVFGAGGFVAADPGLGGYWVARTFATTTLGGVHVTADAGGDGFAAACCLVARLRDPARPVLAVVDAPIRPEVDAVVAEAARRGVSIAVEVWSPDGMVLGPDAHLDRLRTMAAAEAVAVGTLATDASQLDRMLDVAGEIIAWDGRRA
jgi:acetolactate synthase-1/2/3 large subunit